jgi:hypothetical protein
MVSEEIVFKKVSEDERRTIYSNTELLGGKEISIIKLNKDKAIGGCMHESEEYWTILDGCVVVSNGTINEVALPPDAGTFLNKVPHAFFAEEDSIIIEYGLCPKDKKDSPKDEELLNRVKLFNDIYKEEKKNDKSNDY